MTISPRWRSARDLFLLPLIVLLTGLGSYYLDVKHGQARWPVTTSCREPIQALQLEHCAALEADRFALIAGGSGLALTIALLGLLYAPMLIVRYLPERFLDAYRLAAWCSFSGYALLVILHGLFLAPTLLLLLVPPAQLVVFRFPGFFLAFLLILATVVIRSASRTTPAGNLLIHPDAIMVAPNDLLELRKLIADWCDQARLRPPDQLAVQLGPSIYAVNEPVQLSDVRAEGLTLILSTALLRVLPLIELQAYVLLTIAPGQTSDAQWNPVMRRIAYRREALTELLDKSSVPWATAPAKSLLTRCHEYWEPWASAASFSILRAALQRAAVATGPLRTGLALARQQRAQTAWPEYLRSIERHLLRGNIVVAGVTIPAALYYTNLSSNFAEYLAETPLSSEEQIRPSLRQWLTELRLTHRDLETRIHQAGYDQETLLIPGLDSWERRLTDAFQRRVLLRKQ